MLYIFLTFLYVLSHTSTHSRKTGANKTLLHSSIEHFVVNKIGQNKNRSRSWRCRRIAWCRSGNHQKESDDLIPSRQRDLLKQEE